MISKFGYIPDPKRKRIAVITNGAGQSKIYKRLFKDLKKLCSFRIVWKPDDAIAIIAQHSYDIVVIEDVPFESLGADLFQIRNGKVNSEKMKFIIISSHGECPLKLNNGDIFFNTGDSLNEFFKCFLALLV